MARRSPPPPRRDLLSFLSQRLYIPRLTVMSRSGRAGRSARRCGKAAPANASGEVTVKCSSNYRYALGKRLPHHWSVPAAGGALRRWRRRRRRYLLDTNFQESDPAALHPGEAPRAAECKRKEGGPLLLPVISLFRGRAQTSRASLYPLFWNFKSNGVF